MLKAVRLPTGEDLVCWDTGLPIHGQAGTLFHWDGAEIQERLSVGARRATQEFPFRGSSTHPIHRVNPQTSVGKNLPVLYIDFIKNAEYLEILMVPKGSGSENMSTMKMFIPADGVKAVKKFILDTFIASGANPCPPGVIGVGIGGTADLVMRLAKEAIARPIGRRNEDRRSPGWKQSWRTPSMRPESAPWDSAGCLPRGASDGLPTSRRTPSP
jgi:fumarate hydratase subunit alpha/L(+)-tartrate dehydratase alpha subunit